MTSSKTLDCIIIGGGPAGLVAAVYLKRLQRSILLIDRGNPRVLYAPRIRNLVGYARGISGRALLARLKAQVKKFRVPLITAEAIVYRDNGSFEVEAAGQKYRTKTILLATG